MVVSPFILGTICLSLTGINLVSASCEPEVSFPPPRYTDTSLQDAFKTVTSNLDKAIKAGDFKGTSFSLEISSSQKTLYSKYHTDKSLKKTRVNGDSVYRIASNTKLFTALGILQQEAAGKLSLDDRVVEHIPKLPMNKTRFDWERITIRSLLAHLSGIPDNYGDNDLYLQLEDPTVVGLPPISASRAKALPKCNEYDNYSRSCTDSELNNAIRHSVPVFPAQSESTYSNDAYDLLGQILARVSGMKYEEYISQAILNPLGLKGTSFTTPSSSAGVDIGPESQWGENLGADNASGGIYSTSSNMITFLRWILNNYNSITPRLNWLQPATWSTGSHSTLGYPWEIFRTTSLIPNSRRPVTFYTKGGGLTGYYSYSIVIPAYDLVVFMAMGGNLPSQTTIFTSILNPLVLGAEDVAEAQLKKDYAGTYTFHSAGGTALNSSMMLTQNTPRALHISSLVSNSTDVLAALGPLVGQKSGVSSGIYFALQPTFLSRTSADGHVGEVWRFINVIDDYDAPVNPSTVWDDYCVSNVDPLAYAGVPLNEVIFWREQGDAPVEEVELSAFDVRLRRE
ncbi:beta-lactamase family protein [Penicillium riverlandense]|uniref:beta-lactamase family protein n=1 Tax=Penicillium riverlandense TaxID=1903569 RepID=UPI002548448C|nr:beta-lactamase family protein [Penicillium riverlandense]KAJ5832712.1 beta-lactamase family protein [Penicillium riverlandense]